MSTILKDKNGRKIIVGAYFAQPHGKFLSIESINSDNNTVKAFIYPFPGAKNAIDSREFPIKDIEITLHIVEARNQPIKFYLRNVRLNAAGYDNRGDYWGADGHNRVFHYISAEEFVPNYADSLRSIEDYIRAYSRDDAKRQIIRQYPKAEFFN